MEEANEMMQEVSIMENNPKTQKKSVKKTVGYMVWGLLLYSLIELIVTVGGMLGQIIIEMIRDPELAEMSDEEFNKMLESVKYQEFVGILSCVVVVVGVGIMFLYFKKRIDIKEMFSSHKKMKPEAFFQILCVFLGIQLLTEPIFMVMEKLFNLFGLSIVSSMEQATMASNTVYMVMYAVVLAPVAEELVYRGFVLTSIKKYGKVFAIIVSAFLFGIMHENIPQSVFATFVGIVLGYVAIEYSIWWAILLHVINNGLSDVFYLVTKGLSEKMQNGIFIGFFGACLLLGVFFIWKNRRSIKQYIKDNMPEKKVVLYAFTTVSMILFIIYKTYMAIEFL